MNREIKFRAWNIAQNRMLDDIETHMDLNLNRCIDLHNLGHQIILMQYTGLKDKNGKEIYENDVVNYDSALFKVVFLPGEIGMKRINPEKNKPTYRLHKIQGEVVSNIYETSELIKP